MNGIYNPKGKINSLKHYNPVDKFIDLRTVGIC